MATPTREYEVGQYYHVYSRGNRKQPIFYRRRDRQRFLDRYRYYAGQHPVTTFAYCLMDNHFHFLVQLDADDAITKLFSRLCTSHAKYINLRYDLTGSLFQDRFHVKRIRREAHLLHMSRYIHRNPDDLLPSSTRGVEPGRVIELLSQYEWSSLGECLGIRPATLVQPQALFALTGVQDAAAYRRFMEGDIQRYRTIQAYISRFNPRG